MSEETAYVDPEIAALYKALHVAWVLIGRCDNALEQLASPHLSKRGKDDLILKIRAEIARAVASSQ